MVFKEGDILFSIESVLVSLDLVPDIEIAILVVDGFVDDYVNVTYRYPPIGKHKLQFIDKSGWVIGYKKARLRLLAKLKWLKNRYKKQPAFYKQEEKKYLSLLAKYGRRKYAPTK